MPFVVSAELCCKMGALDLDLYLKTLLAEP